MPHKAGFVNILGRPNVGKSTLMNALMGEKLSIISPKAQTTRHRIRGLVNGEDFQIVFTDTPGIVKPAFKLHESMMRLVETALADADVFIYVVEMGERPEPSEVIDKMNRRETPLLLVLNKIDLSQQDKMEQAVEAWKALLPAAEILPVSALHKFNTDILLKKIISLLPESEPYFPKEDLTDQHERFFVAEIVREKIFLNYSKEIPYSTEVEIESYKEEEKITRISILLHVMRESQKGILLGHQGSALKKMATEARLDIEEFIGQHVFIEFHIKISKDWRNDENALKKFGYDF